MAIGVIELSYSDFLKDPICAYYKLDSKNAVILLDGENPLAVLILDFALERLKVFKAECGQPCEIQEINFYDLLHDPGCLLRAIQAGKYVHVVGDEVREDETCAVPFDDLNYILYC